MSVSILVDPPAVTLVRRIFATEATARSAGITAHREYLVGMSIIAHGLDLIECGRIARILGQHPDRFLVRVLTQAERERAGRYKDPVPFVAGRFAAKEAILKMIGTGWRGRIAWTDMEILPDAAGRPVVTLRGETGRVAENLGISRVLLSITHTKGHAAASAIGLSD